MILKDLVDGVEPFDDFVELAVHFVEAPVHFVKALIHRLFEILESLVLRRNRGPSGQKHAEQQRQGDRNKRRIEYLRVHDSFSLTKRAATPVRGSGCHDPNLKLNTSSELPLPRHVIPNRGKDATSNSGAIHATIWLTQISMIR